MRDTMRNSIWEIFGDSKQIRRKWLEALRVSLADYTPDEKRELEQRLFSWPLDEGVVDDVLQERRLLTTSIFRRLAGVLGLDIGNYVKFDEKYPLTEPERKAFAEEMSKNACIAFGLQDGTDAKPFPDLSVEAYLLMRAYSELDDDPQFDALSEPILVG